MRFVEDHGEVLVGKLFVVEDLTHRERERLNRHNEYAASLFKLSGKFRALGFAFFADGGGYAVLGAKALYGAAQLIVEDSAVRHDQDRIEDRLSVRTAEIRKLKGRPGDRLRLS